MWADVDVCLFVRTSRSSSVEAVCLTLKYRGGDMDFVFSELSELSFKPNSLLLVVRPGAPSSVALAPTSDGHFQT